MALQGNDPGALRQTATGLKFSSAALTGVATVYQSLATHASTMASLAAKSAASMAMDPALIFKRADQLTLARQYKERAEHLAGRAKQFQQIAGNMLTAANGLDGTAARQDAASSAVGFAPPPVTIPGVPTPAPFDPPSGGDPTVDPPGGGPPNSPSPDGGVPNFPGGDSPGDLTAATGGGIPGFGRALGGPTGDAVSSGLDAIGKTGAIATQDQEREGQEAEGELRLGLVPGVGAAAAGVAVAGVVGAGIAASVLRANRRAAKRDKDTSEDEERDGDDVEAVYQAGPGQRPPTG